MILKQTHHKTLNVHKQIQLNLQKCRSDEMAHDELPHLGLQCLPLYSLDSQYDVTW